METLKILTRFELPVTTLYLNDLLAQLSCGLDISDIIGAATVSAYADHSPFGELSDASSKETPTTIEEYLAMWETTVFCKHVPNDNLAVVFEDVAVIFYMFYGKLASIFKSIVVPPTLKGRDVKELNVVLKDDAGEFTDVMIEAKLGDRSIDNGKISIRKGAHAPVGRIEQNVPHTHLRNTSPMSRLRHRLPSRARGNLQRNIKREDIPASKYLRLS